MTGFALVRKFLVVKYVNADYCWVPKGRRFSKNKLLKESEQCLLMLTLRSLGNNALRNVCSENVSNLFKENVLVQMHNSCRSISIDFGILPDLADPAEGCSDSVSLSPNSTIFWLFRIFINLFNKLRKNTIR